MIRPVVLITARRGACDLDALLGEVHAVTPDTLVADPSFSFGVALSGGLARAAELGYSHAVTLDATWGHSVGDLSRFIEAVAAHPDSIITGVRESQSTRLTFGQRFARTNADFWTWAETGHWVRDCTFGYRAYPLANVADLVLRCDRFAADTELLVKAVWVGTPVVEIPLAANQANRPAEMLPIAEVHHFFVLSWKLLCERMLIPAPLRRTMHRKPFAELPWWRRLGVLIAESFMQHRNEPGSFAACVGIGVFFGIAPVWGFQMLLAATVAHALRLSKALVLLVSNISSPLTLPLIIYASVAFGHAIRARHFNDLPGWSEFKPSMKLLGDYLVGSVALALVLGAAAALVTYTVVASLKLVRTRKAYHHS